MPRPQKMRETSLEAYSDPRFQAVKLTQKEQIVDCLRRHGLLTRHQLSNYLPIPINAIAGRVNELIKAHIVRAGPKEEVDPDTGYLAEVLSLEPEVSLSTPEQRRAWGSGQGYSRVAGHLHERQETADEIINRGW
jgi:hypothetical protein